MLIVIFLFVIPSAIYLLYAYIFHCKNKHNYPWVTEYPSHTADEKLHVAELWHRGCALLLDLIVVGPFLLLCLVMVEFDAIFYFSAIIYFIAYFFYKIYFEAKYGQTIGKMWVSIKVLDDQNQVIRIKTAIIRNSLYILSSVVLIIGLMAAHIGGSSSDYNEAFSTLTFLGSGNDSSIHYILAGTSNAIIFISFFTFLFNERGKAAHDYLANTKVVNYNDKKIGNAYYIAIGMLLFIPNFLPMNRDEVVRKINDYEKVEIEDNRGKDEQ